MVRKALTYAAVLIIVVIVGGLTGWYLFLRSHGAASSALDAARGLGQESPIFSGNLGSNSATDISGVSGQSAGAPSRQKAPAQRLWEVDRAPVAGEGFALASSSNITLYFVERGNGYVFAADAILETSERLTNTLMPRTYEALFAPGVDGVALRSIDENGNVKTILGGFASSTNPSNGGSASFTTQPLDTRELPLNIRSMAMDPKSGAVLYLASATSSFGARLTSVTWSGVKPKQLFAAPLLSWRVQFMNGLPLLTEKPADDMSGYAYGISLSGAASLFLGPSPGLEVLPHPSEQAALFSASSGGRLALYVKIGRNAPVALPLQTLAEKCVWAPGKSFILYCAVPSSIPSSHFMNDWYAGRVNTSDTWWQVDTSSGTAETLYTPNQALDVQDPTIDPSGNYIAFRNAPDQSLWLLRVAQ